LKCNELDLVSESSPSPRLIHISCRQRHTQNFPLFWGVPLLIVFRVASSLLKLSQRKILPGTKAALHGFVFSVWLQLASRAHHLHTHTHSYTHTYTYIHSYINRKKEEIKNKRSSSVISIFIWPDRIDLTAWRSREAQTEDVRTSTAVAARRCLRQRINQATFTQLTAGQYAGQCAQRGQHRR